MVKAGPDAESGPVVGVPSTARVAPSTDVRSGPPAPGRVAALGIQWRTVAGGVRTRLVLIAVITVLVALAAGGGLLVVLLQANLRNGAASAATSRAAEVASFVRSDGLSETGRALQAETRSGQFVQVVDQQHRVVAASSPLVARGPLSRQSPADGATSSVALELDALGTPGDWIVLARGMRSGGQLYVIQVAVPIDVERQTVQTVALFILGATPVLLIVVAVAVWILVGRTLRPVEQIRATVAGIEPHRLSERVTVPPTSDEIAALASTMNVMLARLESADTAQRAFVSDASHELRSPLAALTASLEVAAAADDVTRTELITMMSAEVERMGGLVEDLMTLARADSERLIGSWSEVDLDDVVEQEVRRLRSTSRHRIRLAFEPVQILGDDRRLTQVLRNLLDNAERYATTEILVELGVDPVAGVAVLSVDNDGPGIAPADRERVFDRFVRLDASRHVEAGGRGLGLAISRRIVEAHQGKIAVTVTDSEAGRCRFEVRLPLRTP